MNYEITQTTEFSKWLNSLDNTTKARVLSRLFRVENGNFGDFKKIDNDLFELRFKFSSGIRVYYTIQNNQIVLLVNGGDKKTQSKDIKKAKALIP